MAEVRPVAGASGRGPFSIHRLATAAFPDADHPGAVAYLPESLGRDRLAVVVYLHGFENCAENVVRPAPGPCVPGGAESPAADLAGHLDRSGRGALLLVPELRFFARDPDPGALGEDGALAALLDEALAALGEAGVLAGAGVAGGLGAADVRTAAVISHSGGYQAAAALAARGGVPVGELYLLDSLYGAEEDIDRYLGEGLGELAAGERRYVNLYGPSTARRSQRQARRLAGWLAAAGLPAGALLQSDDGDLRDEELAAPLLCRRVPAQHSDIPITYLGRLLARGRLPERPAARGARTGAARPDRLSGSRTRRRR